MTTHQCPIPGCTAQIPNSRLMCLHHWHLVPKKLQKGVNSNWREFLKLQQPTRKLAARKLYLESRDAALQAVISTVSPLL